MARFRKILVPVDFSSGSRRALHHAIALARSYSAELFVLHVWEPPRLVQAEMEGWRGDDAEPVSAQMRRVADEQMREFLDDFGFSATERPDYELVIGSPAERIIELAHDRGFDLIVMGTRGRTGFSRLLVGSVAENVVRRAPCPVLTVREPRSVKEVELTNEA